MGANNEVIAINEAEINKIMLEVIDCSNKVKSIFNSIDDQVEKLKANYSCASATTLYKQYENFNDNYSVIVNNMLSYNEDMTSLKKRYISNLGDLSDKIKAKASKIEASNDGGYKERR